MQKTILQTKYSKTLFPGQKFRIPYAFKAWIIKIFRTDENSLFPVGDYTHKKLAAHGRHSGVRQAHQGCWFYGEKKKIFFLCIMQYNQYFPSNHVVSSSIIDCGKKLFFFVSALYVNSLAIILHISFMKIFTDLQCSNWLFL